MVVVLNRTAAAYAPFLGTGVQPRGAIAVGIVPVAVALVWRGGQGPAGEGPDFSCGTQVPIPPESARIAREEDGTT